MGRMSCPYCLNSHTAGTLFCPETGKPIPQASAAPAVEEAQRSGPSALRPSGFGGGPRHVEPAGIAALLQKAFDLYKKHFVALAITCGIVLIPLGLVGGLIGLRAAADPAVGEMKDRSDRVQSKSREMQALQKKMANASPEEQQQQAQKMAALQKEMMEDARAQLGAATGMIARLVGYLLLALLLIPLQIIATWLAQAALIPVIGDRALGGSMQPGQAWSIVLKRIIPLVITAVLGGVLVGIGVILCVVPGLVLAFLFAFSAPIVMLEGKSGVDALKRSAQLVKNHWLEVLIVGFIYAIIIGVIGFTVRAILGGLVGSLLQPFINAALFPLPTLALVLLYLDVRKVDEGALDEDLHQSMVAQG